MGGVEMGRRELLGGGRGLTSMGGLDGCGEDVAGANDE